MNFRRQINDDIRANEVNSVLQPLPSLTTVPVTIYGELTTYVNCHKLLNDLHSSNGRLLLIFFSENMLEKQMLKKNRTAM